MRLQVLRSSGEQKRGPAENLRSWDLSAESRWQGTAPKNGAGCLYVRLSLCLRVVAREPRNSHFGSRQTSPGLVLTPTPAPLPTPTCTSAPPTLTPTPPTTPRWAQVVFGTAYRQTARGFEVVDPQPAYPHGNAVAYVAWLGIAGREHRGATEHRGRQGGPRERGPRDLVDLADPQGTVWAGRVGTSGLPEGDYTLKLFHRGTILAEGEFAFCLTVPRPTPAPAGGGPAVPPADPRLRILQFAPAPVIAQPWSGRHGATSVTATWTTAPRRWIRPVASSRGAAWRVARQRR